MTLKDGAIIEIIHGPVNSGSKSIEETLSDWSNVITTARLS
jgi:hypothetical protein